LDARAVTVVASELNLPQADRRRVHEPISIEKLDPALLDALRRLIDLLGLTGIWAGARRSSRALIGHGHNSREGDRCASASLAQD
jgi:hypothetical protein